MTAPQQPKSSPNTDAVNFSYFLIRVTRGCARGTREISGVVERLGSSEKRVFHTGDGLMQVVTAWLE